MDSFSTYPTIDSVQLPSVNNGILEFEGLSNQPFISDSTLTTTNKGDQSIKETMPKSLLSPISGSSAHCSQPINCISTYPLVYAQTLSYTGTRVAFASPAQLNPNSLQNHFSNHGVPSHLPFEVSIPVLEWTPSHVSEWMHAVGLEELASLFADVHRIDGPTLLALTERDLRQPPLALRRLGDIKRVVQRIASLRADSTAPLATFRTRCYAPAVQACDQPPAINSRRSANDLRSTSIANSTSSSLLSDIAPNDRRPSSDSTDRRLHDAVSKGAPCAVPSTLSANDAYTTSDGRRVVFENGVTAHYHPTLPVAGLSAANGHITNGHITIGHISESAAGAELVHDDDDDDDDSLSERSVDECEMLQQRTQLSSAAAPGPSAQVQQQYTQTTLDLIPPDYMRCALAFGHLTLSLMVTSVVMVYAHERVPDRKSHPPLPDLLLENLPFMERGFVLAEWCGLLLFWMWLLIVLFHRHRFVVLRRTFALAGTIFYLRAFTMIITSLSVPSTRSDCNAHVLSDRSQIILRAWQIFSGFGMTLQGVRTCGDYMFSGHTVVIALLNHVISEYTPRSFYLVHTAGWVINVFALFFILLAHEHYSIDIFIAFYITSRLFLYYHTLAGSPRGPPASRNARSNGRSHGSPVQAGHRCPHCLCHAASLQLQDQHHHQQFERRTRVWFPLFHLFEANCHRVVPNEFSLPGRDLLLSALLPLVMLLTRRLADRFALAFVASRDKLLLPQSPTTPPSASADSNAAARARPAGLHRVESRSVQVQAVVAEDRERDGVDGTRLEQEAASEDVLRLRRSVASPAGTNTADSN